MLQETAGSTCWISSPWLTSRLDARRAPALEESGLSTFRRFQVIDVGGNVLIEPSHVDAAIKLLLDSRLDSVKSITLARKHPHKMWLRRPDGGLEPFLKTPFRVSRGPDVPRAELNDVYWQNGVVDVTRREVIQEQRVMIGQRVAGLVVDPRDAIDIDTPIDLALGEVLLANRVGAT